MRAGQNFSGEDYFMSASKQPVIKVPKHTDMLKYNISVVLQLHLQALKYDMSSQI